MKGVTVWFTGLSGAGKSTLANLLAEELRRRGRRVELLDGDVVRENLSRGLGFSKEDRDINIRRIGFVADMLTRNGVVVLVAAISPYRAVRDEVRTQIGDFIEVHVDCNLDELVRRDVKGLYAMALRGEIANFTGVSDPYEAPESPEVRVDSAAESADVSLQRVLTALERRGYLARRAPGIAPHGGALEARLLTPEAAAAVTREAASLPSVELDAWALSDLELLAVGALSPLRGFMRESDLVSVRDDLRLADGTVWSLPVILPVDRAHAASLRAGDRVALRSNGRLLGVLTLNESYDYDRALLAERVYGTSEEAHPGVARTLATSGFALAGEVEVLSLPEAPFSELRLTPEQTRAAFAERGWRTVVGFQTRNPVHRAHEYLQKVALEQVDGLLLHPLVGETKGDDIPAATRLDCYRALLQGHYPADRVMLSVFPASMRYAGPREAIFHALVRKNYGCTHFIVGRDHAGVGSYYGTYEAQEIFDRFGRDEIGIEILRFEHAFWCRACGSMATTRTCPHGAESRLTLSGTRVRELLRAGEELPVEFTRPEVASVLRAAEQAKPAAIA